MINARAASDDGIIMAAAVARYNIKHFCKRLVEETDETRWQTLFSLIAEEKAKLNALMDLVDMRPDP
jgi:hypothetical protein